MNDDQPFLPPVPSSQPRISCTKCSYDLAGLDLTGSCPECGTKIITNCYQCNYILEGLDSSGQCPECGFPISDSVGRGVLSRSEPSYIAKLHRGVVLIEAAIILTILHAIGGVLFSAFGLSIVTNYMVFTLVFMSTSLAITLMFVFGWYRFSAPNPSRDKLLAGSKSRRWIRVMLAMTVLLSVLQFVNYLINFYLSIYSFGQILSLFGIAVYSVRFYSEMFYVRWMAPLLRNTRAYKRTTTLMWMGPILFGMMVVSAFAGYMAQPSISVIFAIIIGVSMLAMLIMYWNMLDWIRKDLKAIRASYR